MCSYRLTVVTMMLFLDTFSSPTCLPLFLNLFHVPTTIYFSTDFHGACESSNDGDPLRFTFVVLSKMFQQLLDGFP